MVSVTVPDWMNSGWCTIRSSAWCFDTSSIILPGCHINMSWNVAHKSTSKKMNAARILMLISLKVRIQLFCYLEKPQIIFYLFTSSVDLSIRRLGYWTLWKLLRLIFIYAANWRMWQWWFDLAAFFAHRNGFSWRWRRKLRGSLSPIHGRHRNARPS